MFVYLPKTDNDLERNFQSELTLGILAVFKIHKMNEGKFLKQRKQTKNIHSDLRNVISIRKKSQHWEIKRKPEKNPV